MTRRAATLKDLMRLWPRAAYLYKRLADVREYAGARRRRWRCASRRCCWTAATSRCAARWSARKTGKELLQDYAIDGKAAIAAYEAEHARRTPPPRTCWTRPPCRPSRTAPWSTASTPSRRRWSRTASQEIAEVTVPSGAQLLALRTIKADGTVLEPENIEGKDTISLPGVQVGDYVEVEYLLAESAARAPRSRASPPPPSTSRSPTCRTTWSTYTVVAPKGTGMRVDAHGMKVPPPETKGDVEVFSYEARQVPPFIPEPDSPPSANEYLPFVMVGAGTTGNERVVCAYADAFL